MRKCVFLRKGWGKYRFNGGRQESGKGKAYSCFYKGLYARAR